MDLKTLIDAFLVCYQGRDPSRLTRLRFWREQLGGGAPLRWFATDC